MPVEGMKRKDYRLKKFGTIEYSNKLDAQVKEAGLSCGIEFNFNDRTPNTFLAHRLIWFATKQNQNDLMELLFQAYFCQNKDIGDIPVLMEIGVEHGFDHNELESFLASDQGVDQVKEELNRARELNVNGVPAFVIDNEVAFSGAQDPDTIARILQSK